MGLRILFVAFEVPYPLDRGGRIKTYHYLRALAHGNRVTLVAIVRTEQQAQDLTEQFAFCQDVVGVPIKLSLRRKLWQLIRSLPGRKPFVISLYNLPGVRRAICRLSSQKEYDVFYYDHLHMAQYRSERPSAVHILDEHNIETTLLERVYRNMRFRPEKVVAWLEWQKMQHYEPRVCQESDHVIVTTEIDARVLRQWRVPAESVQVIPIGVDTHYFQPITNTSESCRNLTIMGTLGWPPNAEGTLWFYNHVFPSVRRAVPEAHLNIIGDRAPSRVVALAQDPDVSLLGHVDDVRSHMAETAALLVPLLTGSGMRVKILDGLAMGVPIVSTPVGHEGIAVVDGEHLLSARRPENFAHATISLLQRPELRQRLASRGRDLVVQRYSWQRVYETIDAFEKKLAASRKSSKQRQSVSDTRRATP